MIHHLTLRVCQKFKYDNIKFWQEHGTSEYMPSGEYRISTSTLVIYWAVFNQESDPLDEPMTQRSHDKECTLEKLSLKYARKQQNILKVTENNFNTHWYPREWVDKWWYLCYIHTVEKRSKNECVRAANSTVDLQIPNPILRFIYRQRYKDETLWSLSQIL